MSRLAAFEFVAQMTTAAGVPTRVHGVDGSELLLKHSDVLVGQVLILLAV